MIDRDTIIDLVAAVDTAFMKQEVGTYNQFDKYATFALHIEAIARAEEREACAKVCENGTFLHEFSPEAKFSRACARAIRARREQ